ncbi:GTPase Era [Anaerobranca gottschalkii]|uniref:GTPase Era n=1 Tax=Anaerobranca gottschalkii DSM 13577 TaxID=1120990 RepID=A0A1H9YD13_9FIRM|nr:GTPase Era [Anaerobranca gottschalkii]SES66886.1 GTP-binding protein Era [Anaerobranca gottschalkii DSM 13577]
MFKSGFVSIIGRPNVGKSTLLNNLLGQKVAITSDKAQTTRTKIHGVLTGEDYQIVFIDTPGIHKPKHKLGEAMVKAAKSSTLDVDVILFITDISQPVGRGDQFILEGLQKVKTPVVLVANKIDQTVEKDAKERIAQLTQLFPFKDVIAISALQGVNTQGLVKLILEFFQEGPKYYPDDMITDQPERVIVQELIREKILELTREEIPHGVAVEVVQMTTKGDNLLDISANIYVERESHKGIIIGKGGKLLKEIGKRARIDMEHFFNSKVYLELWVKVKKNWRDLPGALKEFGLDNNE